MTLWLLGVLAQDSSNGLDLSQCTRFIPIMVEALTNSKEFKVFFSRFLLAIQNFCKF